MQIIHLNPFNCSNVFENTCACVGYFDGIHIGHRELIEQCKKISKEKGLKSAFITFDPDPWTVFHNDRPLQHLTTMDDKKLIVNSYGIDIFYTIEFSKEFAAFTINQFHELLHTMNVKSIVCGFDYRYSSKNSGDIHTLKEQPYFDVHVVESVNAQDLKISTTRIEPLVEKGTMLYANSLLGYIYSISGTIEHGFRRGSDLLKIPTANLKAKDEYILPGIGVYAGYVLVDDSFYVAMINVGKNPTFENQNLTIEAHILDFNRDIYEKECRFYFYSMIRGEKKFESFIQLKEQLLQDIETTQTLLKDENELFSATKNIWNK